MTPAEVHSLAVLHGLTYERSITATAIAWAESGLRPDAVGDVDLEDEKWGPSIGLYQIRSLRADTGTGRDRDIERLGDPSFNTRSMVAVSAGGTNWQPWSVFKNGRYLAHIDAVRAAVGGTVEPWLPEARRVIPANTSASSFVGAAWKVCLHTTEGGGNWAGAESYHGSQSYPHFEVEHGEQVTEFFPIDVAARALYNAPGGVETNRANVVQIEIVGRAAEIESVSDDVLGKLATIIRFVHEQTGMAMVFPLPFRPPFTSGYRLEGDDLTNCEGIIGHQHFGEGNDHTDPGAFPVARLAALLDSIPKPPNPEPLEEDDDTMRLIAVDNDRGIFLVSASFQASGKAKAKALARHIGSGEEIDALVGAGVVPGYDKRPALPEALFDRLFSVVG